MKNLKMVEMGLVPVYEKNNQQLVDARELHEFLGSKRQFSDWIKYRISKYGFKENEDYYTFSQTCEKPQNGRPTIEYLLTIDTAKEIAMVESNFKGRQVRKYFIAVEKKYRELQQVQYQRQLSKVCRRELTDSIRDYIPESPNKHWKYKHFTDLAYKVTFGRTSKQLKEDMGLKDTENLRDHLNMLDLQRLEKVENEISVLIEYQFPYDKIKDLIIQKYILKEIQCC